MLNHQGTMVPDWARERYELEQRVAAWCEDRISVERGYPRWDFEYGNYYYLEYSEDPVPTGVFIFSEEARVAFRLTFNL